MNEAAVLDAHADPDVLRPGQGGRERGEALVALGQDLEDVMLSLAHRLEDLGDHLIGDVLVEEVAHRVDEDELGLAPLQRKLQAVRPEPQVEALLVRMTGNAAPALRERLGVAVRASRGDLVAARDGVPARGGPLDAAVLGHGPLLGLDFVGGDSEGRTPGGRREVLRARERRGARHRASRH